MFSFQVFFYLYDHGLVFDINFLCKHSIKINSSNQSNAAA